MAFDSFGGSTRQEALNSEESGYWTILPPREGKYDWLSRANDAMSRRMRHAVARETQEAVARGWYRGPSNERLELLHPQQAEANTVIVARSRGSSGWPDLPPARQRTNISGSPADRASASASASTSASPSSGPSGGGSRLNMTKAEVGSTVLSLAVSLTQRGRKVAAISAASAYNPGGGFATGGRHALEEAICTQSTLYPCLQSVWRNAGAAKGSRYIPEDGVLLSPDVEIFRDRTSAAYTPLAAPVALGCVVSMAMPNLNPKVTDAPSDTFKSSKAYQEALKSRWCAALHAACLTGATDLVVPDVGCGVYQNEPADVGKALSEVLHRDFADRFEAIYVVGSSTFFAAASSPVEANRKNSTAASQLKAKVIPARKGKANKAMPGASASTSNAATKISKTNSQASTGDGSRDETEQPQLSQQLSGGTSTSPKGTVPLSESNLRRWLSRRSSGMKRPAWSKRSTATWSTASSVQSATASEMEESTAGSGTWAGYSDNLTGSGSAGVQLDTSDGGGRRLDTHSGMSSNGGASLTVQGAAADTAALLEAAAQREDVRQALQAPPPTQPPSSYNDQPGADLALAKGSGPERDAARPTQLLTRRQEDERSEASDSSSREDFIVLAANRLHQPGLRCWRSPCVVSC